MKKNAAFFVFVLLVSASFAAAQTNPNAGVEDLVRSAFADAPAMIDIARCESGIRQFSAPGVVVKGAGRYVGIFQIDEITHRQKAMNLGYDIYTAEGNAAYARSLYNASGTGPWKGCLHAVAQAAARAANPGQGAITRHLDFGQSHPDVLVMQKILNRHGHTLAASGPGSPGNETAYFGQLTREAVKKFQCAQNIVCSGTSTSTGFGRVGPRTMSALNQLAAQ